MYDPSARSSVHLIEIHVYHRRLPEIWGDWPTAWWNQQLGNPPTKTKQIDANPPWMRLRVIKLLSYLVGIFKNNYSIMVLIETIMFQASKVWKPLMTKIRASIKRTLIWSIQLGHCKDFLKPSSLNNCKPLLSSYPTNHKTPGLLSSYQTTHLTNFGLNSISG